MTKIKLYYNTVPGRALEHKNQELLMWHQPEFTAFHHILNTLGIEYEWSNNPNESLVVLDIGSTSFNNPTQSKILHSLISKYSETYKHVLVHTSQEPINNEHVASVLELYPNVYLMDICYSTLNASKYIPFPSFFVRMINNSINEVKVYPYNDLLNCDRPNTFNSLKFRWTVDKFYAHYLINKHKLSSQAICTYKRPEAITTELIDSVIGNWHNNKDKTELYHIHDFLQNAQNQSLGPHDTEFHVVKRAQPQTIFSDTFFSLVSENVNTSANSNKFYISEKTLYPLVNNHPFVCLANKDHHKFMVDLGFELYDNLFDYSFDSIKYDTLRFNTLIEQLCNFSGQFYKENLNKTVAITTKNVYNINNMNSNLWTILKKQMNIYMERIFDNG